MNPVAKIVGRNAMNSVFMAWPRGGATDSRTSVAGLKLSTSSVDLNWQGGSVRRFSTRGASRDPKARGRDTRHLPKMPNAKATRRADWKLNPGALTPLALPG